jgi:hypothetical protein
VGAVASTIDWNKPQPGPSTVAKRLKANFLLIRATGIYNDRNVAGTKRKSSHAEGRGLDIHLSAENPDERLVGDQLFKMLIDAANVSGIDNVIWNKEIWSIHRLGIRTYHGVNPHTDHIHVEFTRAGSQLKAFRLLEMKIAQVRSGLEDLHGRQKNLV